MNVAAVLLAAGGATRFRSSSTYAGAHKLLAPLRGTTVFECALANLLDTTIERIVIVRGAVPLPIPENPRITVVDNERWAEGQATSLAAAIDVLAHDTNHESRAGELSAEAMVVGLGDQPFIPAESWHAVADADPHQPLVVATYDGKRRNPVRIDRSLWDQIPRTGDEGARPLLRLHPHLVTEVVCSGNPADIDTAEDLLKWS
jgi:molybdenum cofactor cytidylyltransferase